MTEQSKLDAWKLQYIHEDQEKYIFALTFKGYKELEIPDGFRMGYIECWWSKAESNTWICKGNIWLDDDHAKCPSFFRDAVLWHEYCHYEDCVNYVHVDHCASFQRLKWRKPHYAIGDIVLKLIGWIWFD